MSGPVDMSLAGKPRRSPTAGPLAVQMNVLKALILRDIRTRFFGHGLGYLISIAWPIAHIVLLIGIYMLAGRIAPHGSSVVLWFVTGLVPVMSFMYASRWIMLSVALNQPLLSLPVVKLTDIIIARSVLETAAACCMALTMLLILWVLDIPPMPNDLFAAGAAFGASVFLGVGTGVLNAVIARLLPMWVTGYALVLVLIYATSGVVFVPDALPEPARQILSWNPVLHGVEWMRQAYYGDYGSQTLDRTYVVAMGVVPLFLGLALERLTRSRVS